MPSPADPVAFQLGGIAVRWYALFILGGILAAILLVRALARRRGLDPDLPLDVAPLAVFAGVAGARLTYVLLRADYFVARPLEALNLRLGGLSIHGSLLFGGVAIWWWCRRTGQPLLQWLDLIVPGVALGQAIGRWGNWANQEAFGRPTTLPWGLTITPEHRPLGFADSARFHPTFLYESLFNLLNAALLSWIALNIPRRRWLREGDAVWTYCITYGVGRFLVEGLRTDSLYVGPLPGPIWASSGLILAGLALLALSRRDRPTPIAPVV